MYSGFECGQTGTCLLIDYGYPNGYCSIGCEDECPGRSVCERIWGNNHACFDGCETRDDFKLNREMTVCQQHRAIWCARLRVLFWDVLKVKPAITPPVAVPTMAPVTPAALRNQSCLRGQWLLFNGSGIRNPWRVLCGDAVKAILVRTVTIA